MPAAAPPVSVVVPARNAAGTIDAQLAALVAQQYQGDIEVIVVDNGSDDGTSARASAWSDRIPGLRVLEASDGIGPGHARNVGFAAATNEFVLMCDADDVVDHLWAQRLVDALGQSDATAGGAVSWTGGPLPRTTDPAAFRAGMDFLPAFSSCSAAVRRQIWKAVGGFDESLLQGEDLDLAWRIQLAGFRMTSEPRAFVYYREPASAMGVFRKWVTYGQCQVRLAAKHRAAGLRGEPFWKVGARWVVLVLTSYRLLGRTPPRRLWARDAGRRVGRLIGSVRQRTWYP
jgi:glycosyltransferase involved in cell wall biosynthesis